MASSMPSNEPTLLFFRSRPTDWKTNTLIASSLQSIESSFLLLALNRYPHALTVATSAIESVLQASNIGAKEKDGLQKLVDKAKKSSQALDKFSPDLLDQLRTTRNRITHKGFSPQDDPESVKLYLSACLPLLTLCYHEFHGFDLLGGLVMEYAKHLKIAGNVLSLCESTPEQDTTYCLDSFVHLVKWSCKENFSANWEANALVHAEEIGIKYDHEFSEKERLERVFDCSWPFNCPVCEDYQSAIGELDSDALDDKCVIVKRLVCTNCGFVVFRNRPHLSQVLLQKQIPELTPKILTEYGLLDAE